MTGRPGRRAVHTYEVDGLQSWLIRQLQRGMERAGVSQRELARRAGVHESVVSSLVTGRKNATVATWDRLLRAAGYRLG